MRLTRRVRVLTAQTQLSKRILLVLATLVQSERFGTSVADALRVFAESLREQRSQRAQEAAEKMAVKLLFPLVLCIFPAMLIVVSGPPGALEESRVFYLARPGWQDVIARHPTDAVLVPVFPAGIEGHARSGDLASRLP
jgi:pilus assembly protein TadC